MASCDICEHRYYSFYNSYYSSEEELVNLLIDHGVMKRTVTCTNCAQEVKITKNKNAYVFMCRKTTFGSKCTFKISARSDTFVGDIKLSIHKIMFFCLYWLLHPLPRQEVIMDEVKLKSRTVVDWSMFCREVCIHWMLQRRQKLGGLNTIVEIYESKFGRKKYKRRAVEGQWVFGGIQREEKNKFFLVPVEQRNRETLLEILQQWIIPGSIIISNCWKAYDVFNDEDFTELKKKNNLEFISTGKSGYTNLEKIAKLRRFNISTHTRAFENRLSSVKYSIPCFGGRKQHFEGYFAEYIFKLIHKREHRMHHFLKAAAELYPPQ